MKILVTGTAGFIGFHLASTLLDRGDQVVGIDNLNDYYDVKLKKARRDQLIARSNYQHFEESLEDTQQLTRIFKEIKPDRVVNLAAQAGVRYSLENPHAYIDANINGFINILENCRHHEIEHLVYASSSSVYGANTSMPFSVHDNVDHPLSLYAATKKSNELMAHTYSHLYQLPTTGLRFFTVYGPWGRPDMALFLFTKKILNGEPIQVFNQGKHKRDFTYINDIVTGIVKTLGSVPTGNVDWDSNSPDPATSQAPYKIFNIGNNQPVELMHMIQTLENCLGTTAKKEFLPMQPGDVPATYANIDDLIQSVDYKPNTSIETGIEKFVAWYRSFYNV